MKNKLYKKVENAFYHAKDRCQNKNNPRYPDWGGRGIEFRFNSLQEFIIEIGIPKTSNQILDRINNDGHYEKGNIRWTNHSISSNNRRKLKTNKTGITGVCAHKNMWYVTKQFENKQVFLWQGKDFFEACCRRKAWEVSVGSNMAE